MGDLVTTECYWGLFHLDISGDMLEVFANFLRLGGLLPLLLSGWSWNFIWLWGNYIGDHHDLVGFLLLLASTDRHDEENEEYNDARHSNNECKQIKACRNASSFFRH